MTSPMQRSLEHLRQSGYLADVVERRLPGCLNTTKDLYGFLDILAIREGEVLGIQATSGSNVSARVRKITGHENVAAVRKAGIGIKVHGWRKAANGRWTLREVDLS
jgi:hypothetical protein